jgi:hypothetical protein
MISALVKIKGGLPVVVVGTWMPPEPEIGFLLETMEDLTLHWLRKTKTGWRPGKELPKEMVTRVSKKDWDLAEQALWNTLVLGKEDKLDWDYERLYDD